jgi:hypothetical protein
MKSNLVHVVISSSVPGIRVLAPQRSTANPFEWAPLPSPDITPATPLLRVGPTAIPPYFLLTSSASLEASFWERHGSPKFRCKPLNDLPWTQTPARRDALTNPHAAMLASRENNPWPSCDDGYFGAQYLHLRYGRSFAIPLASRDSLPPHVQSSVQAWWLAFSLVGLSNWFVSVFNLAHTFASARRKRSDQARRWLTWLPFPARARM